MLITHGIRLGSNSLLDDGKCILLEEGIQFGLIVKFFRSQYSHLNIVIILL